MRIWHDNSGRGKQKSWFLDQVQITDLQTGDRYIIIELNMKIENVFKKNRDKAMRG